MEKEYGVCNWILAKRLEELGDKQKCLWYWQYNGKDSPLEEYTLELDKKTYGISKKDCYAPTVAELGERLGFHRPYQLKCEPDYGKEKNWDSKGAHWTGGFKKIKWYMDTDKEKMIELGEITEANARAKMRIYLLENKLVKGGMR